MKTGKKLARSKQAHNKNKKRVTYWQLGLHLPRKVSRYESRNKTNNLLPLYALIFSISFSFSVRGIGKVIAKEPELLSPYVASEINTGRTISVEEYGCVKFGVCPTEETKLNDTLQRQSDWTVQAVTELIPKNRRSETLMIMHCLLNRESMHTEMNATHHHGDSGMAGGGLQFWEETWVRMRKQMITKGLATEIGSRYDMKESIRTTVWAISEGRALEWGPILRDYKNVKGRNCPTPSWY